jgi:hypothetical protein
MWSGMETNVSNLAGRKFRWSETEEIDVRQRTRYGRKGKSIAESFGRRKLAVRLEDSWTGSASGTAHGLFRWGWGLLFWRRSWDKD